MEAAVSGPVDTVELNVAAPVEERVFDSETGPARLTAFPAAVWVRAPLKVAGPAMLTVFEAPVCVKEAATVTGALRVDVPVTARVPPRDTAPVNETCPDPLCVSELARVTAPVKVDVPVTARVPELASVAAVKAPVDAAPVHVRLLEVRGPVVTLPVALMVVAVTAARVVVPATVRVPRDTRSLPVMVPLRTVRGPVRSDRDEVYPLAIFFDYAQQYLVRASALRLEKGENVGGLREWPEH